MRGFGFGQGLLALRILSEDRWPMRGDEDPLGIASYLGSPDGEIRHSQPAQPEIADHIGNTSIKDDRAAQGFRLSIRSHLPRKHPGGDRQIKQQKPSQTSNN